MEIAERLKARKLARKFKVTVKEYFLRLLFKITSEIPHYYIKQPRTQKAISRLTDITFNIVRTYALKFTETYRDGV